MKELLLNYICLIQIAGPKTVYGDVLCVHSLHAANGTAVHDLTSDTGCDTVCAVDFQYPRRLSEPLGANMGRSIPR